MKRAWMAGIVAACLVLAAGAPAEVLELKSGGQVSGKVERVTDQEVTLALDSGAKVTLPLEKLTPASAYAVKKGALGPADAAGRLALGDFCAKTGLHAEARTEYQQAGRVDPNLAIEVAKRLSAVDDLEAQSLLAEAEREHQAGRHQAALDLVKRLLARFPTSALVPKARDLSRKVLQAMSQPAILSAKGVRPGQGAPPPQPGGRVASPNPPGPGPQPVPQPGKGPQGNAGPGKVADPAKLADPLKTIWGQAKRLEQQGDVANAEGLKADGVGNVSRATRSFDAAVALYEQAANGLKIVPRHTRDASELGLFRQLADELRKKIVNTLLNAAHTCASERNWKAAAEYCDAALRLDPANQTALKLRQKIEDSRITRKASTITNAKPIVHGK